MHVNRYNLHSLANILITHSFAWLQQYKTESTFDCQTTFPPTTIRGSLKNIEYHNKYEYPFQTCKKKPSSILFPKIQLVPKTHNFNKHEQAISRHASNFRRFRPFLSPGQFKPDKTCHRKNCTNPNRPTQIPRTTSPGIPRPMPTNGSHRTSCTRRQLPR